MPLMDWAAFGDAHHRPYLIRARVTGEQSSHFEALRGFIESLNLTGRFALCLQGDFLQAAFESEKEAARTARVLGARKVGRGDEWAGEWRFALNKAALVKIVSAGRKQRRRGGDTRSLAAPEA